jgi:hypothetical protein
VGGDVPDNYDSVTGDYVRDCEELWIDVEAFAFISDDGTLVKLGPLPPKNIFFQYVISQAEILQNIWANKEALHFLENKTENRDLVGLVRKKIREIAKQTIPGQRLTYG